MKPITSRLFAEFPANSLVLFSKVEVEDGSELLIFFKAGHN